MSSRFPSFSRPIRPYVTVLLLLIGGAGVAGAAEITVSNFKDGETIRYPAPLLVGTLEDATPDAVVVTNLSSKRPDTRVIEGLAQGGRFKALTELVPGENSLTIAAGGKTVPFTLNYKPQTNPRVIRAVLFVDNTGDTRFDTPIPNDPQDYKGKYDAVMKLMQSFTAEWMNHYGYGRQTFNLEYDENGKVVVHVVKGCQPADWYRHDVGARDNLYSVVTDEVTKAMPASPSIDCVLIAFSSIDPKTGKSLAYTALGGGKIALFGGACMYSFPDRLADAQKAFLDPTIVDHTKHVSDSVDRFTMWGTASTSIGAMMHENGHSMGLPHTADRRDMMTRGFDHFGRNFVFHDALSARNKQRYDFKDDEVGYWSPESAASLGASVWLDMDGTMPLQAKDQTKIALSADGQEIVVRSPNGIGFVAYEVPGRAKDFVQIDPSNKPKEVKVPLKTVLTAVGKDQAQIRVIDGNGTTNNVNVAEFSQSFVRAWQFAPTAKPWVRGTDAPDLTDADVNAIAAELASAPLTRAKRSRVNLKAHYPDVPRPRAVAYALRTIKVDASQPVRIHTGSDDGLRVWLNGSLVTSATRPRAAKVDSESTDATLNPGDNTLLVEVTDGGGDWALFLRLTDADGNTLQLADDGTLTPRAVPAELLGN